MRTPCPHCQANIEIDPATHATLAGQPHFACPACQGAVPVPLLAKPRLQLNPAPGTQTTAPSSVSSHPRGPTTTSTAKNRNLLILGTTALLVLGGAAFILASKKSGDTHNTTQNTHNEIINNSYFQNLIANGVTTMKDLNAIADIRPHGDGFIGISQELVSWEQAKNLAEKTGSEILAVEERRAGSRTDLVGWIGEHFSSHLNSTLWVSERGASRVLDGADIMTSTAKERQRKVLLAWGISRAKTPSAPVENERSATQVQADLHRAMHNVNPNYDGNGRITIRHGQIVGADFNHCGISDIGPLRGLPLQTLELWESKVRDLSPLSGMKLTRLNIGHCAGVIDISALRDIPLESLLMSGTRVSDLNPLQDAPLNYLNIYGTPVSDLTPLRKSRIETLDAGACELLRDLSPLRGLPLRELHVNGTNVEDLTPLKEMKLNELSVSDTRVSDLRPLANCPLIKLRFTIRKTQNGINEVRTIRTLVKIEEARSNEIGTAEEFWQRFDSQ